MNADQSMNWGSWNFSSNSQDKLKLLNSYFECNSCKSRVCEDIKDKGWRILLGESLIRNRDLSNQTYNALSASKESVNEVILLDSFNDRDECNSKATREIEFLKAETEREKDDSLDSIEFMSEKHSEETDSPINDDLMATVENVCELLQNGPVVDFLVKFKGFNVNNTMKLFKQNLLTEEVIANLILSIYSPNENEILEQSRWAPVLLQQLILPEILEREHPISAILSTYILQLSSSFPDASVQFLCIPLLVEPLENKALALSSPVEEVLRDVIEKSLQTHQRVSLFRSFFKEVSRKEKLPVKENYFPILLLLAETSGAFREADSDFLANLINWLEISSQEHFSNLNFSKFLVAVLKGIAQDVDARREETSHFLSPENIIKLKNIIDQNRTVVKKIAEKTFDSICGV